MKFNAYISELLIVWGLLVEYIQKLNLHDYGAAFFISVLSFIFGAYVFAYGAIYRLTGLSVLILIAIIGFTCWRSASLVNSTDKSAFLDVQITLIYYCLVFFVTCLLMCCLALYHGNPDQKIDKLTEIAENIPATVIDKLKDAGGFLTIGKHEELLEKERQRIIQFLKAEHGAEIGLLEKRLTQINYILSNREALIEDYQNTISDLRKRISDLEQQAKNFPPEILLQAINALKKGDAALANNLFKKVEEEGIKQIQAVAESRYQRGLIAIGQLNYKEAHSFYLGAVQLAPENTQYLTATGMLEGSLGNLKQAIFYYEKVLNILESDKDADQFLVAQTLSNLGTSLDHYGESDKGIQYLDKALAIYKSILNPNHPAIAVTLNNLGVAWRGKDEYEQAIKYHQEALNIRQAIMPAEHPDVLGSLNNLAVVLDYSGQHDQALELYNRIYEILQKILPPNHPEIASLLHNLGAAWSDKGDLDKGMKYYEDCLKIRKLSLPPNHPDTAKVLYSIGLAWFNKNNYDEAIKYYTEALEIQQKVLSTNHVDTANTLNNLGVAWQNNGDLEKAALYFTQALIVYEAALGTESLQTERTRNNLLKIRQKLAGFRLSK